MENRPKIEKRQKQQQSMHSFFKKPKVHSTSDDDVDDCASVSSDASSVASSLDPNVASFPVRMEFDRRPQSDIFSHVGASNSGHSSGHKSPDQAPGPPSPGQTADESPTSGMDDFVASEDVNVADDQHSVPDDQPILNLSAPTASFNKHNFKEHFKQLKLYHVKWRKEGSVVLPYTIISQTWSYKDGNNEHLCILNHLL